MHHPDVRRGVQPPQHRVDPGGVSRRHDDADLDPVSRGQSPERVEVTEMSADEDSPLAAGDQGGEVLAPLQGHSDVVAGAGGEAYAIQRTQPELEIVPEAVA